MKNVYFLLIVIALTALAAFGFYKTPFHLGLDIEGGVRIVYRMKSEDLTADQRQNIDSIRSNIQRIMTSRVAANLGVVEGNVVTKLPDQFIVEIPGFKDIDQAKQVLSTTASIRMYHAKNVSTSKRDRLFRISDDRKMVAGQPQVEFEKLDGTKVKPGTVAYKQMIDGWRLILQGGDLARASLLQTGQGYQPQMFFQGKGAEELERWSRTYRDDGEQLAFVLDGVVLSIAPLKEGSVLRDSAFIDGQFETNYVRNLVDLLNAGALPVDLVELSSQQVDPSIGKGALQKIILAGEIAFGVISVFLIGYYAFPGFVAFLALILYSLFTLAALKLLNATFSLASIAGFILSVGMAVDANVLVFERLKEELRSGKSLMKSVDLGFRRALPAIVDSNACTILTSLVLFNFGDGPVKGFATTLIIGVAISLFTAVTVTRSLLFLFSSWGIGHDVKNYALGRNWFGEGMEKNAETKPMPVVEKSGRYFLISAAIMVVGLIFVAMGGIKPNVEFTGGVQAEYLVKGDDPMTAAQVESNLEKAGFQGATVTIARSPAGDQKVIGVTVAESAKVKLDDPTLDKTLLDATGIQSQGRASLAKIGPSVRQETINNAINGIVFSTLLIVVYLAIRFGMGLGGMKVGFRFGMSTVAALLHDVVVVIGFAGIVGYLFNWQISALFITSMLTVAGFSTHDTIVIFDRIRENLRKYRGSRDFKDTVNISITQSFARSINTSFTVILSLVLMLTVGASTIELSFFNAVMLVGIVIGTYSSIFNASPILYLWDRAILKRKGEGETLVGHARAELLHAHQVAQAPGAPAPTERVYRDAQGNVYGQVKRRDAAAPTKRSTTNDDDE
ncbi:MAG: protein translocase subunit SecD [Fimbriimonadaceae bacterium]|nr:protein translocase subunit SecD [Fimbriimonadaceae bacterium]